MARDCARRSPHCPRLAAFAPPLRVRSAAGAEANAQEDRSGARHCARGLSVRGLCAHCSRCSRGRIAPSPQNHAFVHSRPRSARCVRHKSGGFVQPFGRAPRSRCCFSASGVARHFTRCARCRARKAAPFPRGTRSRGSRGFSVGLACSPRQRLRALRAALVLPRSPVADSITRRQKPSREPRR